MMINATLLVAVFTFVLGGLASASHTADLSGDGRVDQADLAILRSQWQGGGTADINHDGIVNVLDAGILFSSWGSVATTPPISSPQPPPVTPPPSPPAIPSGCTQVLSGNVTVSRLDIRAGDTVCFDPNVTTTLQSSGNIVVRGTLRMRPASAAVVHAIRFINIDESRFVGGGMDPVDTDVGLWVMSGGLLDAVGTAKTPWTRLIGSASAGQSCIDVANASGWQVGDELIVAATTPPSSASDDTFWRNFDRRIISTISGNRACLSSGLTYNHPTTSSFNQTFTAEVLNLTRNIKIGGTTTGRSHVFVRSDRPQTIRFVEISHTGPRQVNPNDSRLMDPVLGRYGLHFHMMGDASRGSLAEGVVVRDSGGHAFVAHGSHGITFSQTVSHDTIDTAYWWDPGGTPHMSHDVQYLDTVASYARIFERFPGDIRATRTAGYSFGRGIGNVARRTVAIHNAFWGFDWPEGESNIGGEGIWVWEDGLAHNNRRGGIFTWQNTSNVHVITRYTGLNQHRCIEHGAYANPYIYEGFRCYRSGPILMHAIGDGMIFRDGIVDLGGAGRAALQPIGYVFNGPVRFERITWRGYTTAAVELISFNATENVRWILQDNIFGGNEAWIADTAAQNHVIEIRDVQHGALELRRRDQTGTYYEPRWNARVTPL